MFLPFNDNTPDRGLFYQALTAVLEIALDDYYKNLSRMFGEEKILAAVGAVGAVGSVNGDVRCYGLFDTSMNPEGIDRHQRLITSYQKLHAWRAANAER